MYIIGKTGTGKSTLIESMALQDLAASRAAGDQHIAAGKVAEIAGYGSGCRARLRTGCAGASARFCKKDR